MMNTTAGHLTLRVFFALWPEEDERQALAAWQDTLKCLCGGRVMKPDTLHATLVFIGEVEVARLEALKLAGEEVISARFALSLDEARYWGHNHILYAAPCEEPRELLQLAGELERHLIAHRFKFDQRDYKPHVTLLRNAHWSDDALPDMPQVCWSVREFVLLQSMHGGAGYQVLARFPLS